MPKFVYTIVYMLNIVCDEDIRRAAHSPKGEVQHMTRRSTHPHKMCCTFSCATYCPTAWWGVIFLWSDYASKLDWSSLLTYFLLSRGTSQAWSLRCRKTAPFECVAFAIVDTPKGENTWMCHSSIICVALLPNVSLTRFGECAVVRIHWHTPCLELNCILILLAFLCVVQ